MTSLNGSTDEVSIFSYFKSNKDRPCQCKDVSDNKIVSDKKISHTFIFLSIYLSILADKSYSKVKVIKKSNAGNERNFFYLIETEMFLQLITEYRKRFLIAFWIVQ